MKKRSSRSRKFPARQSTLLIALASFAIAAGALYLTRRPTPAPLQIAEITNNNGSVGLELVPTTTTLEPDGTTAVTVNYHSPTDHVTAILLKLTYDPTIFTISDLVIDDHFPTRMSAPKIENGTVTATYGVETGSTGLQGTGTFATFKLKAPLS